MEELLHHLEEKLKKLIYQYDKLHDSHQQSHHHKSLLKRQNDLILAKQQKAIVQIETLIARLKTIEK